MAPKGLGLLAAQERFHKPEVPTLTKSGHQREIFDTSQLLKTPELQDQRGDFNETHIALINYPWRSLQGSNSLSCINPPIWSSTKYLIFQINIMKMLNTVKIPEDKDFCSGLSFWLLLWKTAL